MENQKIVPALNGYVLGLDLGAESVGWVVMGLPGVERGEPSSIARIGSHCFDAGVEGDMESGREESRAKVRRDARQPRRQHWRRAWRKHKTLRLLQKHGLLPEGDISTPGAIHEFVNDLDKRLLAKHGAEGDRVGAHVLPYRLRTKGLDERLELEEVGRALYHLGQRRGFLSNRKSMKEDDEEGKVKQGISDLKKAMEAAGSRTLGEYFASLDPEEQRIRQRWTARGMYAEEFEQIWNTQSKHHEEVMTERAKVAIHDAIFDQRPLKSQKHLIGHCSLISEKKRAPQALRIAQRFRLLQKVNDLRVYPPDAPERWLTTEERDTLIEALETRGDVTFASIKSKKVLGLLKGTTFNHEEGGEKKLPGNRTDAKLRGIFDDRWDELSEEDRDQVVEDILSFEKEDALIRRGRGHWSLSREKAQELADLSLESDHANHCREALRKLVDRMEEGLPYATARKDEYPESFEATEPVDTLPPVLEAVKDLKNPAVCRALTELRKVVNDIIRKHGKPTAIRLELARDLKNSRKKRQDIWEKNRKRQTEREYAVKRILDELGIQNPSRRDVDKVLLAEECDWTCPYTGKRIDMRSLMGRNPQFDIEHIWPMSRSMDNSFINRTLCDAEENRHRKRNRTPWEAYHGNPETWAEILERVRHFKGGLARIKLSKFEAEEIPDDWTNRQLSDTRYSSRLAKSYLELLYGGEIDAEGKRRVQTLGGGATAWLRNEWDMNGILNDGGKKERNDHRHHAVDAIAIACCTPGMVKRLADAAKEPEKHGRRMFAPVDPPWEGFLDDAREAIEGIQVSHRVSRKLAGPLHQETNYSKAHAGKDKKGKDIEHRHVRKLLASLSKNEVEHIVDPRIKEIVLRVLEERGGDPKKAFEDPGQHPEMMGKDGRSIPIHKVRIRKVQKTITIGKKGHERHVAPGSNHHMVIVAEVGLNGKDKKWEGHLVSRFEVNERKRKGEPIVQKDWGERKEFRFTIAPGEIFTILNGEEKERILCRVRSISAKATGAKTIEFVQAIDARKQKDIKAAKDWLTRMPNTLFRDKCEKVIVTRLGEIFPAHD